MTWFTGTYPEQLRIAQSVAFVRQLPIAIGYNVFAGVVALLVAHESGITASVLPAVVASWIVLMPMVGSWRRFRRRPPPAAVSVRRIRVLTLYSLLLGSIWGAVVIAHAGQLPANTSLVLVSGLTIMSVLAVSGFGFMPSVCLAYLAPHFAAIVWLACVLWSRNPWVPIVILVAWVPHIAWVVKENWLRFDELVAVGIEKAEQSETLRAQKEVAEATLALKSRFLAAASHDLRQPMHAISLYLGALEEAPLAPKEHEIVVDARQCAHHMNEMFRALLDVSRLDTHPMEPQLATVPAALLLGRVKMEFMPLATAKGLDFRIRSCRASVFTDAAMVERILMNFVSNAVRYTRSGKVLVGCRRAGDALRLEVHDTGPGIPEKQQVHIFDEFYRGPDSRMEHAGGLGLGLSIVRRLAGGLNVPVTVRSSVGRGSTFSVEVPMVHALQDCAPQPAGSPASRTRVLNGAFVVVVDDERAVLNAAVLLLSESGCKVIGAASLAEAMAALSMVESVPDALVCDYQLKDGENGFDAITALREEFNANIPALLVTGDTSSLPAGLAGQRRLSILHKPLAADALRQAVGALVRTEREMIEDNEEKK